jgi:hypothetical protein
VVLLGDLPPELPVDSLVPGRPGAEDLAEALAERVDLGVGVEEVADLEAAEKAPGREVVH